MGDSTFNTIGIMLVAGLLMYSIMQSPINTHTNKVIVYNSYEEELNACQQEKDELKENRDVYCVKEFGKPEQPWAFWIFGTLFYVMSLVIWFVMNNRNEKSEKREKELNEREQQLLERMKNLPVKRWKK